MASDVVEDQVYSYLLDVFNPIYADLVVVLADKPTDIILQLEAAFVHLAVANRNDTVRHENCRRALSHLQRATLDAAKLLWLQKKRELTSVIDDEEVQRFCVNSSHADFLEKYHNAQELAEKARGIEVSSVGVNADASIEAYYEAALAFDAALNLIDPDKIRQFRRFSIKFLFRKHFVGFIFGVGASLVAAVIIEALS